MHTLDIRECTLVRSARDAAGYAKYWNCSVCLWYFLRDTVFRCNSVPCNRVRGDLNLRRFTVQWIEIKMVASTLKEICAIENYIVYYG